MDSYTEQSTLTIITVSGEQKLILKNDGMHHDYEVTQQTERGNIITIFPEEFSGSITRGYSTSNVQIKVKGTNGVECSIGNTQWGSGAPILTIFRSTNSGTSAVSLNQPISC
ncbi:hypothetical protein GEMRC1_003498 [Eukaryota sp. GEM-RC1]